MNLKNFKNKSVGLVLSGGGVKGIAHIGLIQALNEYGIQANCVSGTSVGALVGALYANGNSVLEMTSFFKKVPLFQYQFFARHKPGLFDTEKYIPIFKQYFPENRFEKLRRKLFVTTTNLQKGEQEQFSSGELIRPLLASAALPPVFSPIEINDYLYADGGIMNNFPIESLAGQCDFTIGSNVSVVREVGKESIRTSLQLAGRTTSLMIYAINLEKIKECDLVFEPKELDKIGVLDKKGMERAYAIGYGHAIKILKREFGQQPMVGRSIPGRG
ncbi:patatin-like phospholipase family protein [Flavobacteriaceae bacterium F89]|uniref:Patatin-like phospholipase family protein n=1 Tax=Cerina litoralis TaxID=2874477 RepID=A0AAE3EWE6_9FLAO|nr:patatin-like phospholipase family protein [Cerina litoralis]MCG2460946.1 patatin-like phospholipase family protein [Cerina litoralis]